jgi:hypothetical protein
MESISFLQTGTKEVKSIYKSIAVNFKDNLEIEEVLMTLIKLN